MPPIDADLTAVSGDQQVSYPNGTYRLSSDFLNHAIAVVRPATSGPLKGWRVLSAKNYLGAIFDLAYPAGFGAMFAAAADARLLFDGWIIRNGHLAIAQPSIGFWYCAIAQDPNLWSDQGAYTTVTISTVAGSNVVTLVSGTLPPSPRGKYMQCGAVGFKGAFPKAAPTISSITSATLTVVHSDGSAWAANTTGTFQARVGSDPAQGYYSRPATAPINDPNAQHLGYYGCDLGPAGFGMTVNQSSYVTLQGSTITGIADPVFDPTDVIHPDAIENVTGRSTSLHVLDCDIAGRLIFQDANVGQTVSKAITDLVIENTWHDHQGMASLQFAAQAAAASGGRGVQGRLGAPNRPYTWWNSNGRRIDFFRRDRDGVITAKYPPAVNADPYVSPSRIQVAETNVVGVAARPSGPSPAEQWRTGNPRSSLFDFFGWANPVPTGKTWKDATGPSPGTEGSTYTSGEYTTDWGTDFPRYGRCARMDIRISQIQSGGGYARYDTELDRAVNNGATTLMLCFTDAGSYSVGGSGTAPARAQVANVQASWKTTWARYKARYPGVLLLAEFWNEPNHGGGPFLNTSGKFDIGELCWWFQKFEQAIHTVDSSALVAFSAFAPQGTNALGSKNFFGYSLVSGGDLFSPLDGIYNCLYNPGGILGANPPIDVSTIGWVAWHAYQSSQGPTGRHGVARGAVWPTIPATFPQPYNYCTARQTKDAWQLFRNAGMGAGVKISATESGGSTAPYHDPSIAWGSGEVVYVAPGTPDNANRQWQRAVKKRATTNIPSGVAISDSRWAVYPDDGTSTYQGLPSNNINEEDEEGAYADWFQRVWFGADPDQDGVNIGPITGYLTHYNQRDEVADKTGMHFGMRRKTGGGGSNADGGIKGSNPASTGVLARLSANASNADTRGGGTRTPVVPDAPTLISVVPGDAQITVQWTAPNDHGFPVTRYELEAFPQYTDRAVGFYAKGSTAHDTTAFDDLITVLGGLRNPAIIQDYFPWAQNVRTTATGAASGTSVTVAGSGGITVGMTVIDIDNPTTVPDNTTVTHIAGTTITTSAATTIGNGDHLTFSSLNSFPNAWCDYAESLSATPMLVWQASQEITGDTTTSVLAYILSGAMDAFIDSWADAVIARAPRVYYFRLFHEFNLLTAYPWCAQINGNTPDMLVAAWRYVVMRFRRRGALNARWCWCPSQGGVHPLGPFYPGDAYVDIVAMDGYNRNTQRMTPFSTVFGSMYDDITSFTGRPIIVTETASVEHDTPATDGDPDPTTAKARWIEAIATSIPASFPQIKAVMWFNGPGNGPYEYFLTSSADVFGSGHTETLDSFTANLWDDPTWNGAIPIPIVKDVPAAPRSAVLTAADGIVNDVTYIVVVRARNVAGDGPDSGQSAPVTPHSGTPPPPTGDPSEWGVLSLA